MLSSLLVVGIITTRQQLASAVGVKLFWLGFIILGCCCCCLSALLFMGISTRNRQCPAEDVKNVPISDSLSMIWLLFLIAPIQINIHTARRITWRIK